MRYCLHYFLSHNGQEKWRLKCKQQPKEKVLLESLISSPEIHLFITKWISRCWILHRCSALLQNFEPRLFLAPHKGQHGLSWFIGITVDVERWEPFPILGKDILLNVLYVPSIHKAKPTTIVEITCDSCEVRATYSYSAGSMCLYHQRRCQDRQRKQMHLKW